jgi:allantoin racemase
MKILVINPNTCETMTAKIGVRAKKVASPGTEVFVTNPTDGCPSIEGFYDMQIATVGKIC